MRTARAVTITTKSHSRKVWSRDAGSIVFLLLLALYALMFLPFWKPVLLGFLFASASAPLQQRLRSLLHSQRRTPVAYGILVIFLLLVVTFFTILVIQASSSIYQVFENSGPITEYSQKLTDFRNHILNWLQEREVLTSVDLHKHLGQMSDSVLIYGRDFALNLAREIAASTPEIVLSLFIFFLAFTSFLLMGSNVFISTANVLGVEGDHAEQFRHFERVCALALGSVLLTGLMQASFVVLGSWICGLGNYYIIFAVTFIFAMVPLLGGGIVPLSLAVYAFVQGDTGHGIVLASTAAITFVSDNILKAWMFSRAAKTNPLISLICLIGGVTLFGFAGLFIAPTVEQLVMTEFHRRRDAHAPA